MLLGGRWEGFGRHFWRNFGDVWGTRLGVCLRDFDKFLDNLKSKAKLENNFKNLGIDIKNDYSKIISGVNMLRLSNNPIELNPSDLKKIIIDKSL